MPVVGGLNKLAEDLEVERIGPEHQAGSDSLLTGAAFFKMRQLFFEGQMDEERHLNILYGLERGANLVKGGTGGGGLGTPGSTVTKPVVRAVKSESEKGAGFSSAMQTLKKPFG